jgi:rSAM/selenodomain-associated transferase 1
MDEQLIVFVKAPRPGAVKTRLAKTMGAAGACAAYRRLVETVLGNLSRLNGVELRHTPDDAAAEFQVWLRPGWPTRPQGEGDLGARMQRAFDEHFAAGAQRVVIVGSDCPEVTVGDIREAWKGLKSSDLVIGPATDGGYWLIGLRQAQPRLFEAMAWGSETVLAETLLRAKAAQLQVKLLRILTDVDTEREWREFVASGPR